LRLFFSPFFSFAVHALNKIIISNGGQVTSALSSGEEKTGRRKNYNAWRKWRAAGTSSYIPGSLRSE
jgi:hypothetical protein